MTKPCNAAPLAGLRVIQIGGEPFDLAAALLAEMGAEVVAAQPDGVDAPHLNADLLAGAHVVLDGRVGDRWSHASPGLRRVAPGLVVVRACDTPPAPINVELRLQAAGGLVIHNGFADRPPLVAVGHPALHLAATHLATAALLGLLGPASVDWRFVVVSLRAAVASAALQSTTRDGSDKARPARRGRTHWSGDFRIVPCRDGLALASVNGDWMTLREWIRSQGEFLAGIDLETAPDRDVAAQYVLDAIGAWSRSCGRDEITEAGQLRRLPFAPVRSLDEVAREHGGAVRPTPYRFGPAVSHRNTSSPRGGRAAAPHANSRAMPLAGLRVLDLTRYIAGPFVTRILADWGAEVITVERVDAGHEERKSGLFRALHRGKKSLALDLSRPQGGDVARRLADSCHFVIDNFSRRVMPNLGLDHGSLRREHDDLITMSMSAFGPDDARRDFVAYAPTLHAFAGITSAMADPIEGPAGWGLSYSDFYAGAGAAFALLSAHWQRTRTGAGRHIDFSQYDNLLRSIDVELITRQTPTMPQRKSCAGVYPCAHEGTCERWVAVAIDESTRTKLQTILPLGSFADGPSASNRAALDAVLAAWSAQLRAEDAVARLHSVGIDATLVANARDLRGDDRLWRRVDGTLVDVPCIDMAQPWAGGIGVPAHGEHTVDVLRHICGLDDSAIAALCAARIARRAR